MKRSLITGAMLSCLLAASLAETTITSLQGSKFFAYGVAGNAEEVTISSHSQQHKAIQSSLNWMELNCPAGITCKTYVRQDFQLTILIKPSVTVDPTVDPTHDLTIGFTAPTKRVGGTALPSSEIQKYILEVYHEHLATKTFVIPSVLGQGEYEVHINDVEDAACWSARAATVDTSDQQSDWAFSPTNNCEG